MWGEREQAMHYSIDCYGAKALAVKYQITRHTGKLSWVQSKAFHEVVPHNRVIRLTSMKLLRLLQLQDKSEHSLACIVLQDLRHL